MAIMEYGHADDYVTVHSPCNILASLIVDGFYGLRDRDRLMYDFIDKLELHISRRYYPQYMNDFEDKEKMKVFSQYD